MSGICEAPGTIKIVEIEERTVVDIIEIVVIEGIIAGIPSPIQVGQRFNVILAIGRIAVGQNIGLLFVHVTFIEFAHHLVQSDVILRRSGTSGYRRRGRTVLIFVPIFVPVFVLVIVAAATYSVATTAHVAASAIRAGAAGTTGAVTSLHGQCYLWPNFHAGCYSPILIYPRGKKELIPVLRKLNL